MCTTIAALSACRRRAAASSNGARAERIWARFARWAWTARREPAFQRQWCSVQGLAIGANAIHKAECSMVLASALKGAAAEPGGQARQTWRNGTPGPSPRATRRPSAVRALCCHLRRPPSGRASRGWHRGRQQRCAHHRRRRPGAGPLAAPPCCAAPARLPGHARPASPHLAATSIAWPAPRPAPRSCALGRRCLVRLARRQRTRSAAAPRLPRRRHSTPAAAYPEPESDMRRLHRRSEGRAARQGELLDAARRWRALQRGRRPRQAGRPRPLRLRARHR